MSLRIQLVCNGLRHRNPCRAYQSSGIGYSRDDDRADTGHLLLNGIIHSAVTDGWRIGVLPNGGDLCPSRGHDEDPPGEG